MLTQFFLGINWVDVALFVLLVRVVFISIKTGFVVELFKFLGVFCALFISLHLYPYLAAVMAKKTTLPLDSWQFLFFVLLWVLVVLIFKFLRDALLLMFRVETAYQTFDKYAAGFLGASRAIFLSSLVIFACLLLRHEYIHRQALTSWGHKVAAKAAPNTYSSVYHNIIARLFPGQQFNADVFAVVSDHGVDPKRNNRRSH